MTIVALGACAGGLLTLLSPCSVMLLPASSSYEQVAVDRRSTSGPASAVDTDHRTRRLAPGVGTCGVRRGRLLGSVGLVVCTGQVRASARSSTTVLAYARSVLSSRQAAMIAAITSAVMSPVSVKVAVPSWVALDSTAYGLMKIAASRPPTSRKAENPAPRNATATGAAKERICIDSQD